MSSNYRLKAAAKLYGEGESMLYASEVYSLHKDELKDYIQASLSAPSPKQMSEKSKGVAATKGHMAGNGGIRGHNAGEIFPYVIVLKGNFTDGFKYCVTGGGFNVDDNVDFSTYILAQRFAMRGINSQAYAK